ncbi:MAG TPA: NAD(P)H-hydrate epimerase, partial [Trueperaceae bacterium]|nr:NAD(P)H-hydrate epimerase [Trueperaceae bacterium]
MKLFSSAQMRAADAAAEAAGIAVADLMEVAGAQVAQRLLELFPAAQQVLVLCGKGNNGGDGYVAASHLLERGLGVEVLEMSSTPATDVAVRARASWLATGQEPLPLTSDGLGTRLQGIRPATAVIVDALFGCGLTGPLAGEVAAVAALVNDSAIPVLAVDVPSGVSADTPLLPGPHIEAHATVQLAGAKVASAFYPARAAFTSGLEVDVAASVADIGIPAAILAELSAITLLTKAACSQWLPARSPAAHKYSAGTVTVVAGSSSYAGAAELACRGAWRGGAGLVRLVGPHRHPAAWPETVYHQLPAEWPPAGLSHGASDACVVGPGLVDVTPALLSAVLGWTQGPVVLDAGALAPEVLWRALSDARPPESADPNRGATRLVLTPHAGEAARLLATSAAAVDADPLGSAARLSQASRAIVVLKGPSTVIAAPDGSTAVSTRGHPGMASGGTG